MGFCASFSGPFSVDACNSVELSELEGKAGIRGIFVTLGLKVSHSGFWATFSNTIFCGCTKLSRPEGREDGRVSTLLSLGLNLWGIEISLAFVTISYGCLLLVRSIDWDVDLRNVSEESVAPISWRNIQRHNCSMFSWCASRGDKLHWGPDPLWTCH